MQPALQLPQYRETPTKLRDTNLNQLFQFGFSTSKTQTWANSSDDAGHVLRYYACLSVGGC
jgi:hypothetical protein